MGGARSVPHGPPREARGRSTRIRSAPRPPRERASPTRAGPRRTRVAHVATATGPRSPGHRPSGRRCERSRSRESRWPSPTRMRRTGARCPRPIARRADACATTPPGPQPERGERRPGRSARERPDDRSRPRTALRAQSCRRRRSAAARCHQVRKAGALAGRSARPGKTPRVRTRKPRPRLRRHEQACTREASSHAL